MSLSRREVLAAIAAGAVLKSDVLTAGTLPNLGNIASARGLLFGSAFDIEIFDAAAYRALVAENCRVGAVENTLKFDWLRPNGPVADFSNADRLVAFAAEVQIAVRGTALIWNDWTPDWLSAYSSRQIAEMLDLHVEETIARYAGRMQSWDVVNEPFFPPHDRDGGYRGGPWFDALGKDYVARAFRRAAAADPKAHLVLNEAFCEQNDDLGQSVRPLLLELIDELKGKGIKLDAIGFQAHLKPYLPFNDGMFTEYLAKIAERDVDIYITELDVDDSHLPDDAGARDWAVAMRCHDFLTTVLAVPRVKTVICWHLSDRYSWYASADWYAKEVASSGGNPQRGPRTHLLDADLQPKAAWNSVASALQGRMKS
jgi:endo-1,4-beta-xylanase